jgi:hypothetical protein
MDVRITIETTFDNGEKRTLQLEGISRPYRVTCPDGIGLRLEDGKRIVAPIQSVVLYDQVDEIIRESRACPDCASVRAIHDYRTRDLDTLFGWVRVKAARAAYAVLVMPGQQRRPADLFLRWPISFQTGLPRNCSGRMRSLGPGIHFAKPRG